MASVLEERRVEFANAGGTDSRTFAKDGETSYLDEES